MDEIFVFFLFMGRKQASKQPEIRNRRKVRKTLPEDEEKTPSPSLSTSEAGRRGGSAVRDKYGEEYYRRIGKKGGAALKEKRGNEYYRTIAQKGGQANVSKYGSDHFSEMGDTARPFANGLAVSVLTSWQPALGLFPFSTLPIPRQ